MPGTAAAVFHSSSPFNPRAGSNRLGRGTECPQMRAMAFIWAVILIGGITYFSIIGLTHQ
jgi:hypothetical protein